jgi:hypothetical protein
MSEAIAGAGFEDAASKPGAIGSVEWRTRIHLAALYRLVALQGWDDLIFTHITARVPGPESPFPDQSIRVVLRGNHRILPREDRSRRQGNRGEFCCDQRDGLQHSIHGARQDAQFVLHLHTDPGVAVAAQSEGLLPLPRMLSG